MPARLRRPRLPSLVLRLGAAGMSQATGMRIQLRKGLVQAIRVTWR